MIRVSGRRLILSPGPGRSSAPLIAAAALLFLLGGCAYYNTFYNAEVQYRDGMKLVNAGNSQQAKAKFEAATKKAAAVIANYPKSRWVDDALYLIGMCYYQSGDYTKAVAKFDNLEAVFPHSGFRDDAQFYRALSLIDDRQYAQGILGLKALRDSSRAFREAATLELASASFKQGEYDAAIAGLDSFEKRFPRTTRRKEARWLLAEAYLAQGEFAAAARAFAEHRKLATHSRDRALADMSIAECYLQGNCADSALNLMRRQTDKYPEYSDRVNLITGKALLELGRKPEALQTLGKVKVGVSAAEAYFLMGRAMEQDTNFALAGAYYDTAKMRDPGSVYASQANSRRLLISRLLSGQKGEGDTAQSKFLLAEVYHLNLEQDSLALQQYQRVVDSFPRSPYAAKALFAVAWIKQNKLKTSDSLLAYRQVIDRYPRTAYAQRARELLGQPLLPPSLIEKTPEAVAESLRQKAAADSALVRKERADSLARVAEKPGEKKPETPAGVKPAEEPVSDRGERGRDRRSQRERPSAPGTPSNLAPLAPETDTGKPATLTPAPPAPSTPSQTAGPDTVVRPAPSGPAPVVASAPAGDTLKKLNAPTVPVESARADTGRAVAAPAQVVRPETLAKPAPTGTDLDYLPDSALKSIYFAFDQAVIRSQDTLLLTANVDYLKQYAGVSIEIAGFCDPRGSAEYNELLGLRRAQAARDWLKARGIDPGRIKVTSFGEERGLANDPALYWRERRCEFWTAIR